MRSRFYGVLAAVAAVLLPAAALAQNALPDAVPAPAPSVPPRVTRFPTVLVLPAIPVSATAAALPVGVTGTTRCFVADATRVRAGMFEPIRFVGNVLCLDPGPDGEFRNFAANCPDGTAPVIQGIQLIKTEPTIPKCPDMFPGGTFAQTPQSTGIRTFFPLKFTPCDTTFELRVDFACVGGTPRIVREVRENVFRFRIVMTPETLSWVLHALHNEPLGTCEVPCITDEALFDLLLRQADVIAREAAGGADRVRPLSTAIDTMEATLVAQCLFALSIAQVDRDARGNVVRVVPCAIFGGSLPGDFTIRTFGFGIVDTLENPCCCKLIADLFWLKRRLIGASV